MTHTLNTWTNKACLLCLRRSAPVAWRWPGKAAKLLFTVCGKVTDASVLSSLLREASPLVRATKTGPLGLKPTLFKFSCEHANYSRTIFFFSSWTFQKTLREVWVFYVLTILWLLPLEMSSVKFIFTYLTLNLANSTSWTPTEEEDSFSRWSKYTRGGREGDLVKCTYHKDFWVIWLIMCGMVVFI